ncbi:MAG TPA: class D sortase [Candidatus Acidoferrales bacterium]|jgi:sortase A|nr:class D sortase [Candidatus Acidoferrales bacterium]
MSVRGSAMKTGRRASALTFRGAFYFFLAAGILALGYAGYVVGDTHAYQAVEKSRFDSVSRSVGPHPVMQGGVIGEIDVPRLGIQTMVVEGDSNRILRRAVGHMPETALPWESGNVALAGHRDSFFRPLRNIRSGDMITLETVNGDFQYEVESTEVVPANDMHVLDTSSGHTLTLITCFPFYYVGSAPNRFIVRAREVGSARQITGQARTASF